LKDTLLLLLCLAFFVTGVLLAHPESREIMRGDYEFDQWMFVPVSSKTWLLVFLLGLIGGCVGYLSFWFYRRTKNGGEKEETTTEGFHTGDEGS